MQKVAKITLPHSKKNRIINNVRIFCKKIKHIKKFANVKLLNFPIMRVGIFII